MFSALDAIIVLEGEPAPCNNKVVVTSVENVIYNIAQLEKALEQRLEKMVIAKEDVMEAAMKAEKFAMFKTASQALLKNCAKTLKKAVNHDAEFSSQVSGTGDEAICLNLFAMIKDLQSFQPQPSPCSNCRKSARQGSPCISGAEITSITIVSVGTRLVGNSSDPDL